MSLCLSWVLPWSLFPRQERPSPGPSCAAMRTWREGPDPSPEPREGAAVWEEGAWENRLWMQIWSFYSPAHRGPSRAQPQLCSRPCQKGKCFEGFGVGPASDALRAVLRPSSAASSAWLLGSCCPSFPQASSNRGPPWSLHTQQPRSSVSTHQGPPCIHPDHQEPLALSSSALLRVPSPAQIQARAFWCM